MVMLLWEYWQIMNCDYVWMCSVLLILTIMADVAATINTYLLKIQHVFIMSLAEVMTDTPPCCSLLIIFTFGEHKSRRLASLVLSWPPNQRLRMSWLTWQVYRLIPSENQRAPLHLYLATSLEMCELSPLEALNGTDFTQFSYWLACISYLFTF